MKFEDMINTTMNLNQLKKVNKYIYNSYRAMYTRCYDKINLKFKNYHDKNIIVCDEWKKENNGIYNFYIWSINNGWKKGLTIDRIDNNGNYEPSNCRWVDNYIQANNKSNNFLITYNGETKTIHEWSKIFGISVGTIRYRYVSNWNIDDVFNILPKVGNNQKLRGLK